jgi:hypothetical protein
VHRAGRNHHDAAGHCLDAVAVDGEGQDPLQHVKDLILAVCVRRRAGHRFRYGFHDGVAAAHSAGADAYAQALAGHCVEPGRLVAACQPACIARRCRSLCYRLPI